MKKKKAVLCIFSGAAIFMTILLAVLNVYSSYALKASLNQNETELKSAQTQTGTPSDLVSLEVEQDIEEKINISFFGDNLIHESILNYANLLSGGNGTKQDYGKGFNFRPIYDELYPAISGCDIAVLNQASLIGGNDSPKSLSGYPLFNSPSALGDELISLGFDVINIANNHMLDLGSDGLKNSIHYWREKDIHLSGGFLSDKEFLDTDSMILEKNGIRIAFLSYTATTNGLYSDKGDVIIPYFLSNVSKETTILENMLEIQVKECKSKADCVIVLINWGTESNFEASEMQKKTANILCEAGANVIIGSGAKVIQPIEWISSSDGENRTLCAYSLGNMMCTMEYMESLLGGYLNFDIVKKADKLIIENVLFTPTVIHYDEKVSNISVRLLEDYSEESFNAHGSNIKNGKGKYSWYEETLKKYITKTYLPSWIT